MSFENTSDYATRAPSLGEFPDYQLACMIALYGTPTVILVGLVGNSLSLLVATRPQNIRCPYGVYVAALAVTDTTMLVGCELQQWIMFHFYPQHMSHVHCLFINYIHGVLGTVEAWTVVSLALERCMCVCHPISSMKYRTRRATVIIMVTIISVCLLKNTHFFFTSDFFYNAVSGHVVCVTGYFHDGSRNLVLDVFEMIFNSLLPFGCILYFNLQIICRLQYQIRYRRKFRSGTCDSAESAHASGETDHSAGVTLMLIVVTLTFILLTSPIFVFRAASAYEDDSPMHEKARLILFESIFSLIYNANFAVNFYLYCLSGSSFRKDLKKMFANAIST